MSLLFAPSPIPFRPHRPTWRQPLYLHYGPLTDALAETLPALRGRVLDVGCGLQPYRALLDERVEYVGLDREGPLSQPTVVGSAEELPFEAASFDAVISTQVLEHVRDPVAALAESARVLRRGGRILVTVPGVWPAHEVPFDYWRFTRHGVVSAFERAGLVADHVRPLGGLWASVGQMVNLELQRGRLTRELVPLVNLAARWLDRRGTHEDLALAWIATGTRR